MIHLDRNHPSPLSPHPSSNLILPTDQIKLLSRSPLTHDDKPVHQETAVELDVVENTPPLDEPVHSPPPDVPTSPNGHRSSSLSPPPDSGSPKPTSPPVVPVEATEHTTLAPTEEPEEEAASPLSELSEQEEILEDDKRDHATSPVGAVEQAETPNITENVEVAEEKKEDDSTEQPTLENTSPAAIPPQSPRATVPSAPDPVPVADGKNPDLMTTDPTTTDDKPAASKSPTAAAKSPTKSPAPESAPPPQEPRPQPPVSNSYPPEPPLTLSKDKGERLLELNVELLKACMEFQAQGIPMNESRFNEYATRLQTNLTWLASAADGSRQNTGLALPIMEPPIAVDFVSMDRIQQLYADLPTIFAGGVAPRQQITASPRAPSLPPSISANSSLKRERPDDVDVIAANKRRDTGESKSPPMRPPTVPPAPPMMNNSPISATFPMSNSGSTGAENMLQSSQMNPTPIAPPSLLHGMPPGSPTQAQIAASQRERARQLQIQQAVRQQQQQQQQQHNARQMSPPSAQGPTGQGQPHQTGPSNLLNNINPSAAISVFGPNALQNIQMLQTPSHPFMQYMTQRVAGFATMIPQQQLQHMQVIQTALQQQKQQTRQGSSGPVPNIPQQGTMQSTPNNGMRSQQFPGQVGGVTSPSTQSSMSQQQQSTQNGTFPFAQNQMNSVTNASNPQMMGGMNMNNINTQQRQLLMMQQQQQQNHQQQMRGGSGNPAMMNSEAYAMAQERSRQEQQQRMSQANSPANIGSPPMSSSFSNDGNSFPALRSNSTIPGIARSTRSPSDGAPSPLSPQMTRGPSQDMRRMVNPSNMGQMSGFSPQMPNWQQKNQLGQQQQTMPMGHLQPPNYGVQPAAGGNMFGGGPVSNQQNWGSNPYPMASSPNSGGYQQSEQTLLNSRQSSSTPAPQMQHQGNSPPAQQHSLNEFEMFNWGGAQ